MKAALSVLLVFFGTAFCHAQERVRMTQEVSGQNEASELLEAVADSASRGELKDFLGCFTTKYGSGIRRKMKDMFSSLEIDMRIIDCTVQSNDGKTMKIRAKYSWDDGAKKRVVTSDIIARMERGSWRVGSESIEELEVADSTPPAEFNFGGGGNVVFGENEDMLPLDMPRMKGGCANGRCGIAPARAQAQVAKGNREDMLPLDMPRMKGGCANGRCGL